MKIAVCDDETAELCHITSLLNEYMLEKSIDFAVYAFQSPVELICQIQNKIHYDILILDIMMPAIGGIDAAKEIREYDKNVKIIFLTSSPEFAVDSYSVGAYYYSLKPIWREKLFSLLDGVILEIDKQDKECLIVKCKNGITRIPINSLEYCEIVNKTIMYYLSNATALESIGSMTELETTLLKYSRFLKPHRSFVVNINFIKSLNMGEILMENGSKIPVPRGKYNVIKQAFLEFSFNPSAGGSI